MTSSVRFEAADVRQTADRGSDTTVLQAIHQAARQSGLEPVAELYNEALELAHEGHYGQARARLQVLLGLAPSDGDAHLLLAKVFVAGQQWRRAVSALDEATQCGARVPEELREAVIRNLQADDDALEEERNARLTREQTELKKLRSEARRMRSEQAHLLARNRTLEREAARWAWVATGTSVVAIAFLLGRFLFGAPAVDAVEAEETLAEAAALDEAAAPPLDDADPDAVAEAVAGGAPVARDPALGARATQLLADDARLEGASLEVVVRDGTAALAGTVAYHAQIKHALELLEALPEVQTVKHDGVRNLARRDGATHVVTSGDSLMAISQRYYGTILLHEAIDDANPALQGKPLQIGQTLRIPPAPDAP